MKNLLILFLVLVGLRPSITLAQNKEGANSEIYYQESRGVNRIAKLDAIHAIQITGGWTTHDPEWMVQVPGKGWEGGTYQWLTYLGTDGKIWRTRTHANNQTLKFKIWMESINAGGGGNNPTFQFYDWSGQIWTVVSLNAPAGNAVEPVYIQLRKGR